VEDKMRTYELAEKVRAETWLAGERVELVAGPGAVKPKNEGEEFLLEELAATRPDVCSVKTTRTKKAED
jgi:hypothetical protein